MCELPVALKVEVYWKVHWILRCIIQQVEKFSGPRTLHAFKAYVEKMKDGEIKKPEDDEDDEDDEVCEA